MGIIVFEIQLGAIKRFVELVIRIIKIVIVSYGILDEAARGGKLLFVRFLRTECPVFKLLWFLDIETDPVLGMGGCCQMAEQEEKYSGDDCISG